MDPATTAQLELLHQADILLYVCLFFYGMAMWEWVSRLPMEVVGLYIPEFKKFSQGKFSPTSLPVILVMINRLALPATVGTSLASLKQPSNCQAVFRTAYSLLGVLTCTCKGIEVLRVTGIRQSTVVLRSVLWTAVLCLFGLWLAFANTQDVGHHAPLPIAPYASTCGPFSNLGRWHNAVWASDLAFEIVIIVLTLDQACGGFFAISGKNAPNLRSKFSMLSAISKEYYFMALLWFVLSFAVNTLQVVWFSTHNLDLLGGLMVPIQIWLTSTVGPRLVVDLKMQTGSMPLLPFTASASQNSRASLVNHSPGGRHIHNGSFSGSTVGHGAPVSPIPSKGSFSSSRHSNPAVFIETTRTVYPDSTPRGEQIEMVKD